MCEYCQKRVCPNGCPNNYTPEKKKREKGKRSPEVEFKIISIYGIGYKKPANVMNIPLINEELSMKS